MRWFIVIALMGAASGLRAQQSNTADIYNIAVKQLRNNVLKEAEKALKEKTVTVTAQTSREVQVAYTTFTAKATTGGLILQTRIVLIFKKMG
ncbi:hypothetical protein LWM68_27825 [Niabella sp. W65]|nr:hypothetical protein [Niabella sp. W65]MCH7366242.1 hypothetical protein [Niabella sp. W65]